MQDNTELTFVGVTAAYDEFRIGGHNTSTAHVGVDNLGYGHVEVVEGCGEESHFFNMKVGASIAAWLDRAKAGDDVACDFLREVAANGLHEIRTLRADPLMLKPTTATMQCRSAGRHEGGPWFGSNWRARLDADETIRVLGPKQTREACIAALHRQAGSHGYIITRIAERLI